MNRKLPTFRVANCDAIGENCRTGHPHPVHPPRTPPPRTPPPQIVIVFNFLLLTLFPLPCSLFRLKALETEPYTQKEAEAAAGMGSYQKPKIKKVFTQPLKDEVEENTEEDSKMKDLDT